MNEKNKPLLIAHRGANKDAPENTLKAFKKAIELKADYVEFDVHGSKDHEIVIMHDADTFRTTGHKGKIEEMTLRELKELDCGEGEQIPTLQELIEVAKGKIGLQCEIKAEGIAEKVIEILRGANLIDSTIISSFKHDELIKIKKIEPQAKLAPLILGIRKNKTIREAIEYGFYAIHPLYKFAKEKFINAAHENNLKINVWTVDDRDTMEELVNRSVDGIITNDVALGYAVIKEENP